MTLQKNEIVIFGSTYTKEFPFYELSQKYLFSNAIYNRSIKGLTLADAEEGIGSCVFEIKPSKLFLSLGEEDIYNQCAIEIYERIIKKNKTSFPIL